MNNKRSWKDFIPQGIIAFLVIVAAMIVFFAIYRVDSIGGFIKALLSAGAPIIFGIIIAYLLNPIVGSLEKTFIKKMDDPFSDKSRGRARGLAIATAVTITIAVILLLLYLVLPTLIETISRLVKELPENMKNITNWLDERASSSDSAIANISGFLKGLVENVDNWLKTEVLENAQGLRDAVTSSVMSVLSTLFNVFVGFIVACYLLGGKERYVGMVKKLCYSLFSKKRANNLMKLMKKSNGVFGGYISGKLVDSLLLGLLCFIFMFIVRLDYAALISVIVGLCNLIPFFGQWISMLIGGALLFLESPAQGIIFVVFIVVLQQVDGNIIQPKIVGNSTGLSPFWVMFAIFVGGGLFGIPGLFLGVPVFAVIYSMVKNVTEMRLARKGYPVESETYYELDEINVETNEPIYYNEPEKKGIIKKVKESVSDRIQEAREERAEKAEFKKEMEDAENGIGERRELKIKESGDDEIE